VERKVVDINTLDQLMRDELDKGDGAQAFGVALWRHKPDETGANWNASVKRIGDTRALDPKLRDVLPKLRANFSLDGEGG
jgi:hypothetical protein